MKSMKRALCVLLSLSLTIGFVFAGGGKDGAAASGSDKLVDGKFATTQNIVVEIYDRSIDGGSSAEDNYYTNFIKAGMLRDHNVAVTFKRVPRWTEVEVLNNLLAAGDAPDVCVTYSYPTIQTYGNMGGVLDIAPLLGNPKKDFPNLYSLLGERNINWNKDPEDGKIWAVEALMFNNMRTNVFVREDWLKKLNLKEPKTLKEFEAMLKAFKDNAKTLLGENADRMIPFSISYDIGWRADVLATSFVPDKLSDKDMWVNGFDDRRLLWPNYKEGIRILNKWYNEGLVWKDFPLYGAGTKDEDNLIKAGYVGAMIHNWDYPYRDGEQGIHASLKKLVGPDAGFIAVNCFKNDSGKYRRYLSPPIDRKVFFPSTNKAPLASLLYLDWISKFENRKFLQIGETGVTHEVQADGSVKTLSAKGTDKVMNSVANIDYTIVINGLDLGDPVLNAKSVALGYAGVDKRYIEKAYGIQKTDFRITTNYNVGEIASETGMGPALKEKRDTMLVQSVVAKSADFDKVYDNGMKAYLSSGGQSIIDERKAKYDSFFKK